MTSEWPGCRRRTPASQLPLQLCSGDVDTARVTACRWVKTDGFYDDDGTSYDLERELAKNLPGMPPPPKWQPPSAAKFSEGGGGGKQQVGKKSTRTHAEKYALKQANKQRGGGGAGAGDGDWLPKETEDGRLQRVGGYADPGATTVWNELEWAVIFLALLAATIFFAVYENIEDTVEVVQDACSSDPCLNGGACGVVAESAVGAAVSAAPTDGAEESYQCQCLAGWVGPECQIAVVLGGGGGNTSGVGWAPAARAAAAGGGAAGEAEEEEEEALPFTHAHVGGLVGVMALSSLGGLAWAALWLALLRRRWFIERVVHLTGGCCIALQLCFGTWLLASSNGFGLLVYLMAGFSYLLFVLLRRWVPFTVAMVGASARVIEAAPGLLVLASGAQLLQLCWLIMWATALAGSLAHEDGWVALLLLLSNLWTMQVIKNVVHVSAAGTAAAWFFQTGEPNATRASLRRALTSSFGSICLGSLLVALIRTLRLCVPSRPRGGGHAQPVLHRAGMCAAAVGGAGGGVEPSGVHLCGHLRLRLPAGGARGVRAGAGGGAAASGEHGAAAGGLPLRLRRGRLHRGADRRGAAASLWPDGARRRVGGGGAVLAAGLQHGIARDGGGGVGRHQPLHLLRQARPQPAHARARAARRDPGRRRARGLAAGRGGGRRRRRLRRLRLQLVVVRVQRLGRRRRRRRRRRRGGPTEEATGGAVGPGSVVY
eukprot:COSAG01_NODE_579_length_15238_cov_10.570183_9_plen_712_part_00